MRKESVRASMDASTRWAQSATNKAAVSVGKDGDDFCLQRGEGVGLVFVIQTYGFPRFHCNRTAKKSVNFASLEFLVLNDTTLAIFHVEERCESPFELSVPTVARAVVVPTQLLHSCVQGLLRDFPLSSRTRLI